MSAPTVVITHSEEFSSAHQLKSPVLDDAQNRELYGPCYNVHGHNYRLEVSVRGPVHPDTGMVMNLTQLMAIMRDEVIAHVDHVDLNKDVDFLADMIPTAETLAVVFWDRIEPHLVAGCSLVRVRVVESRDNRVDYYGPA
ncbi:MAG: 6-pyruvoyltetrahydropterin/6-carboxytetrahydropterin synthase [Planctomycetota bacterium]|jgi:6-pyruvoyltetrahydropterin/6-carboxytetrahydropterin synthase